MDPMAEQEAFFQRLPFHVQENIFLCLDVKSVMNCKKVCKSWENLISTPHFTKAHLDHNINKNRHKEISRAVFLVPTNMYTTIGSSNGLVCIIDRPSLLVANPSTSEVRLVQTLPADVFKFYRTLACCGFGYDSHRDDYKIVFGFQKDKGKTWFRVFSLKSADWHVIGEVNFTRVDGSSEIGVICNGAMHWLMYRENQQPGENKEPEKVILSFDLSNQKFKGLPHPDHLKDISLGIMEECLCIHGNSELWVLKKDNEEQFWEKVENFQIELVIPRFDTINVTSSNVHSIPFNINIVESLVSPHLHKEKVEQPMPSHSATSERVEQREQTQEERIQERLLKVPSRQEERIQERLLKVPSRPSHFQDSLEKFKSCMNQSISIVAPDDMYANFWEEWIEYEAIVDLHVQGWVDISFIHWYTMHLYSLVKPHCDNRCAFLNPHHITSMECRQLDGVKVKEHITETMDRNPGKDIYMAPYFHDGNHWVLIVLCPNSKKGYIVDSLDYKDKDNDENRYSFTRIVESALKKKFDWTMAKCFRQEGGWECGYFLMKFMHDLAMIKQAGFPGSLWDDTRRLTQLEIDDVAHTMLQEFHMYVVAPLDTPDPQARIISREYMLVTTHLISTREHGSTSGTAPLSGDPSSSGNPENGNKDDGDGGDGNEWAWK